MKKLNSLLFIAILASSGRQITPKLRLDMVFGGILILLNIKLIIQGFRKFTISSPIIWLSLLILSILFSDYVNNTIKGTTILYTLNLFLLFIFDLLFKNKNVVDFNSFTAYLKLYFSFLFIIYFFSAFTEQRFFTSYNHFDDLPSLRGFTHEPNVLGIFLGAILLLVLDKLKDNRYYFVVLTGGLLLMALTFTRSALFTFLAIFLLSRFNFRTMIYTGFVGILGLTFLNSSEILDRFLLSGDSSIGSFSGRLLGFQIALEELLAGNILIGTGSMTADTRMYSSAGYITEPLAENSGWLFSSVIQILHDHGILAIIPFGCFYFTWFNCVKRNSYTFEMIKYIPVYVFITSQSSSIFLMTGHWLLVAFTINSKSNNKRI